ncbi:MAG: 50S ribosomal protein L21 [Synergistales bacterium 58_81]|jgi:large subunit ribosomal protein L21|nr:MAG: 50S ribosomal protein L21 [Synergistales bacterium 57_84]KUK89118.1 MAG: 50S ribosomal protein L21 [Synergistales bacterium 58_81]HCP07836.1 50S ribosomal protein L21 [Synergistaceae bacterium]HCR38102.1 50S ribosomal protein L21 [Synergistaceae bacterium]
MYAVIETGGKQYRVSQGDTIRVEKVSAAEGEEVEFSKVLLVATDSGVSLGEPTVAGALVKGRVLEQGRARKITVFKYKNKSRQSRRTIGHRQPFSSVRIDSIIYQDGR